MLLAAVRAAIWCATGRSSTQEQERAGRESDDVAVFGSDRQCSPTGFSRPKAGSREVTTVDQLRAGLLLAARGAFMRSGPTAV